jgi:hypothetical protein
LVKLFLLLTTKVLCYDILSFYFYAYFFVTFFFDHGRNQTRLPDGQESNQMEPRTEGRGTEGRGTEGALLKPFVKKL